MFKSSQLVIDLKYNSQRSLHTDCTFKNVIKYKYKQFENNIYIFQVLLSELSLDTAVYLLNVRTCITVEDLG